MWWYGSIYIYIYVRVYVCIVEETRDEAAKGKKEDRYDLLPAANSVSPWCAPTAFAFIHLFPFHGSPSNFSPPSSPPSAPPPLFRAISQSDWLPPLLSACQHFYTFIHRSLVSIVPGANSFGHNTSRRATIILLVLPKYRQRIYPVPGWRLKSYCGLMPRPRTDRVNYTLARSPLPSGGDSFLPSFFRRKDSCPFAFFPNPVYIYKYIFENISF